MKIEEELLESEMIILECIKNFSAGFKDLWEEDFQSFMKKGWKTWTTADVMSEVEEDGLIYVEDNEYEINFPSDHFKVIL